MDSMSIMDSMSSCMAMQEDMESMMTATGRAIRYVKKVENGQLRVRPVPVVKDRSQIQTAITSAISSAISSALGRSLKPTNKVSKVALRQLFNGGLLGQLAAPATDAAASSGTNIMEEMAMNMVQQQIEQMVASGELETMAMEFLSSGQLEQMVQDFMADPATQQMMEEVMAMPTEEEMAEMEEAWNEMMSNMMSEEEMAQMEQAWMDWEAQMEAEWEANG